MKIKYLLLFLLIPSISYASAPDRPSGSIAVSGVVISSQAYNNDLNTVYTYLQNGVSVYQDGTIVNADVATNAAFSYSKLNLSNSILNADIATGSNIDYAKLNLSFAVKNTDLAGSITDNKLSQITTSGKVSGNAVIVSSQTRGDMLYFDGTNWVRFPSVSSGPTYFLTSQGVNGPPVFRQQTTPALTLSSVTTVSGAGSTGNITLTAGKPYLVVFKGSPSGANDSITMLVNDDTGANYSYVLGGYANGADVAWARSTGQTSFPLSPTINNGTDMTATMYITPSNSTNNNVNVSADVWFDTDTASSGSGIRKIIGKYAGSASVTSIKLKSSSNNISGTVYVYELSTS